MELHMHAWKLRLVLFVNVLICDGLASLLHDTQYKGGPIFDYFFQFIQFLARTLYFLGLAFLQ